MTQLGYIGWILLWCVVIYAHTQEIPEHPTVFTQNGAVEGFVSYAKDSGVPVYTFLGIPYAQPPIRFQPPQPQSKWTQTIRASKQGAACMQPLQITKMAFRPRPLPTNKISEDCLFLNIYSPSPGPDTSNPRPVMVNIHGGSLLVGMAGFQDGTAFAALEDVIIVSINYRLGLFGFLSLGNDLAPGNLGIMDQRMALQWIQANIGFFGGDPDKVTIIGHSAGAACVGVHLVSSDSSQGLFQQAIVMSGSLLLGGMVVDRPSDRLLQLARAVGCLDSDASPDHPDDETLLVCLHQQSAEDLMRGDSHLEPDPATWRIVREKSTLQGSPRALYRQGIQSGRHILTGINPGEGFTLSQSYFPDLLTTPMDYEQFKIKTQAFLKKVFKRNVVKISQDVITYYVEQDPNVNTEDEVYLRSKFMDMVGDATIIMASLEDAEYLFENNPLYYYVYNYTASFAKRPDWTRGPGHAEGLLLHWGEPFLNSEVNKRIPFTEEDTQISRLLLRSFANFAKTGDPNGEDVPSWPIYGQDRPYLQLDLVPKVGHHFQKETLAFWTKTFADLAKQEERTSEREEL